MATKTHPYTSKIQYSLLGSSYTDLTDIESIKPPDWDPADTKVTHLASSSATHEYIASWIESGEATFRAYFTKAQLASLVTIAQSRVTYFWRALLPLIGTETTNGRLDWSGHLKVKWNPIETNDEAIMLDCTIKATGPVTFTAGT